MIWTLSIIIFDVCVFKVLEMQTEEAQTEPTFLGEAWQKKNDSCGFVSIFSLPELVGGFNPFEKYEPKWESSINRGEKNKYLSCHHPAKRLIHLLPSWPGDGEQVGSRRHQGTKPSSMRCATIRRNLVGWGYETCPYVKNSPSFLSVVFCCTTTQRPQ